MKMNKLVKGLLVGFIALQMVGCEEAKEVENLNIQDTNPVEENVGNLGGEYHKFCEYCGNGIFNEKFGEEEYNELIQATYDKLAKLDMNKEDEREKYFYGKRNLECQIKYNGCTDCAMVEDFLLECHNVGFKMKGEWVDEHLEICKATHTNVENLPTEEPKVEEKVEAPVVKEEPKEIAHDEDIEPCVICGEFGFKKDMIRMGEGYYDEFCYNEAIKVVEEVEAPTAMTAEEFDNAKCENCGHDVSDVIDNAGGYWCEACDYVK